jgi:hypothetical protein
LKGSEFCKKHGGKALKGRAHPSYVHGRSSRFSPTRHHAHIYEALNDPNLLSMKEGIALLDARLIELLEAMEKVPPLETYHALLGVFVELERLASEDDLDSDKGHDLVTAGGTIARQAIDVGKTWDEIRGLIDQRARLTEKERGLERDKRAFLTLDEFLLFSERILDAVAAVVPTTQALQAIIEVLEIPAKKKPAELPARVVDVEVIDA